MNRDLELTVTVRDQQWAAEGPGVRAQAKTLAELEDQVERQIRESGKFPAGSKVDVLMATDRGLMPEWMRPYQSHYFNRVISFVL